MSKRMGGMSLRNFNQSLPAEPEQTEPAAPKTAKKQAAKPEAKPKKQDRVTQKPQPEPVPQEKLTTVNIKIRQDQRTWLDNTARLVRDNNLEPVPPSDRTYPQHLIQAAIDLLRDTNVDWSEVRNVDDLKAQLNLKR